jgi:subfamily B ATP-binding cassette protein MsbA
VIENGKIVEKGSHEALITQDGTYKRLHDLQSFS